MLSFLLNRTSLFFYAIILFVSIISLQEIISNYYPKHYVIRECNNIASIISELETLESEINVVYNTKLNATMNIEDNKLELIKDDFSCSKKLDSNLTNTFFNFTERIWINKSKNNFVIGEFIG